MLEDLYGIDGMRAAIVEAVEEELVFNQKGSVLLADVKEWIQEEADRFSPAIQKEVTKF